MVFYHRQIEIHCCLEIFSQRQVLELQKVNGMHLQHFYIMEVIALPLLILAVKDMPLHTMMMVVTLAILPLILQKIQTLL